MNGPVEVHSLVHPEPDLAVPYQCVAVDACGAAAARMLHYRIVAVEELPA